MKYLLLDNPPGEESLTFNVGDDIQSLAAGQYFSENGQWWPKQELGLFQGSKSKYISNGWFMHDSTHWPPSDPLTPLYVSFHINEAAKGKMLTEKGLAHLRRFSPIGCRDLNTERILKEKGIDAYFSGCLTTTLRSQDYVGKGERKGIYLVDILYKLPSRSEAMPSLKQIAKNVLRKGLWQRMAYREDVIGKILSPELIANSSEILHSCRVGDNSIQFRISYAKAILKTYATAKLVITSRIHCALPCLAFNTPVIFVNGGLTSSVEQCRIEGLSDWFNNIFVTNDGSVTNDFNWSGLIPSSINISNRSTFRPYAERLRTRCEQFILDK